MDRIIEGATALVLGFVATLFISHVLASLEHHPVDPYESEPSRTVH